MLCQSKVFKVLAEPRQGSGNHSESSATAAENAFQAACRPRAQIQSLLDVKAPADGKRGHYQRVRLHQALQSLPESMAGKPEPSGRATICRNCLNPPHQPTKRLCRALGAGGRSQGSQAWSSWPERPTMIS